MGRRGEGQGSDSVSMGRVRGRRGIGVWGDLRVGNLGFGLRAALGFLGARRRLLVGRRRDEREKRQAAEKKPTHPQEQQGMGLFFSFFLRRGCFCNFALLCFAAAAAAATATYLTALPRRRPPLRRKHICINPSVCLFARP